MTDMNSDAKKLLYYQTIKDIKKYFTHIKELYGNKIYSNIKVPEKINNFDLKLIQLMKDNDKEIVDEKEIEIKPVTQKAVSEQVIEPEVKKETKETKPAVVDSSLVSLRNEVENCTLCQLSETRKNVVFGEGSSKIKLVIIGEAPGEREDIEGKPFVGPAGQLLTKMLGAINIDRNDIFICNVLKCRPPFNRDPLEHEIKNCSKYLDRQLEILKPEYILCLGRIAAKRLLNRDLPMYKFRTESFEYKGIPVLCTYHPSALLRTPKWKIKAWQDLQKLQKLLNI